MFDLDPLQKSTTPITSGGDAVLCAVSRVVRNSIRPNDIAGRYGGEEFGIIPPTRQRVQSWLGSAYVRP